MVFKSFQIYWQDEKPKCCRTFIKFYVELHKKSFALVEIKQEERGYKLEYFFQLDLFLNSIWKLLRGTEDNNRYLFGIIYQINNYW